MAADHGVVFCLKEALSIGLSVRSFFINDDTDSCGTGSLGSMGSRDGALVFFSFAHAPMC